MDYAQTLDFLYGQLPMFQRQGAAAYKANLNNTIDFCKYLGNPELEYPSIHIAGTNGKGSVSHMTASYLQESKYKTGLYTSPHLKDFRERIRVDGVMVSKDFVVDFVQKHMSYIKKLQPSFFEITFAMAIQYFKEMNVDFAVMETGMGGRLDSTNVVRSAISVITNIGFDHTQFLGDTLEKIAREKAGIIKHNTPVIIGQSQAQIEHVFDDVAQSQEAPLYEAVELLQIRNVLHSGELLTMDILDNYGNTIIKSVQTPLIGNYQLANINTFVGLAMVLDKHDIISFEEDYVRYALKNVVNNTGLQGRWQILNKQPLVIADTGHNEDGLRFIVTQLEQESYNCMHFVLGMVNDKELDTLLAMLPKHATYYFCKANIPRALDAELLMQKANEHALYGACYTSVESAYLSAKEKAQEDDVIFVGGSTFVVAEVL